MLKRFHIIVEGSVQGVGFRYFATNHANALGCTGTVSNLANGMVDIYIQGKESAIDEFLVKIQQGNRYIHVTNYVIQAVPVVEKERSFRCIDYYF